VATEGEGNAPSYNFLFIHSREEVLLQAKNIFIEKGDNYFEKVESTTTDLIVSSNLFCDKCKASLKMIRNVPRTLDPTNAIPT
jgi:hypothetical protein